MAALELEKRSAHLPLQDRSGASGLALSKRFADAYQGRQSVPDGRFGLKPNLLVRLAEMFAALGVAEFDEIEATILQHHRRDFSGPCAVVRPVHGLGATLTDVSFSIAFTSRIAVKGGMTKR